MLQNWIIKKWPILINNRFLERWTTFLFFFIFWHFFGIVAQPLIHSTSHYWTDRERDPCAIFLGESKRKIRMQAAGWLHAVKSTNEIAACQIRIASRCLAKFFLLFAVHEPELVSENPYYYVQTKLTIQHIVVIYTTCTNTLKNVCLKIESIISFGYTNKLLVLHWISAIDLSACILMRWSLALLILKMKNVCCLNIDSGGVERGPFEKYEPPTKLIFHFILLLT